MGTKTTRDKWDFFGALYSSGCNSDSLTSRLPEWSIQKIESFISSYRKRAEYTLKSSRTSHKSDDIPIDLWYDFVNNCHLIEGSATMRLTKRKKNSAPNVPLSSDSNYSFLIGKAMMYAASFEDHYVGDSPEETNYSEIYRYLGQLLLGEEPVQLRPGNAAKVLEMISRVKEIIENKAAVDSYLTYLSNQHNVSYLEEVIDPLAIASQKRNKEKRAQIDADKFCQDYFDKLKNKKAKVEEPGPSDFKNPLKRESALLKLSLKQLALAKPIACIPGLNPLELPPELMVKPSVALLVPTKKKPRKR